MPIFKGNLRIHCTNIRHVCTYLNAFFMLNPNKAMKISILIFCESIQKFWLVIYSRYRVDRAMLYTLATDLCYRTWEKLKFLKSFSQISRNSCTNTRLFVLIEYMFHTESKYYNQNLNIQIFLQRRVVCRQLSRQHRHGDG